MASQTRHSHSTTQQTALLQVSQLLQGRYLILKRLGQGGFSETYLAKSLEHSDQPICVVKHLNPMALSEVIAIGETRSRFQLEIQTLETLGHHNQIPQLLDHLEIDGEFYLVQEWIEGRSLHSELATGQVWTAQQVLEFLGDILPVLEFVHQHHIIHRDIKPENIIRRQSDGRLVLIDFGSVKHLSARSSKPAQKSRARDIQSAETMTVAIRSQGYTPIEQLCGQPRPASDIYAVGMVAIQGWTGQHPKDLEDAVITETEGWKQRSPTHPALAAVLRKMTQRDWADRYQSVDEILEELKSWQAEEFHSPESSSSHANLGYTPTQIVRPAQQTKVSIQFSEANLTPAEDADYPPGLHPVPQIPTEAIATSSPSSPQFRLEQLKNVPFWLEQGCRYLFRRCGVYYPARTVRNSASVCLLCSGLLFSGWLLYGFLLSSHQRAMIEESQTIAPPRLLQSLKGSSSIQAIALEDGGRTLFTGNGDKTISLWDLTSGQVVQVLDNHFGAITALDLSTGTHRLASGSDDANINVWNTITGERVRTLRGHQWSISAVAFAADGQTLVSSGQDNTIRLWNGETGESLGTLSEVESPVLALDLSPDGSLLLAGSADNTVQVWNVHTGELLRTLRGHAAPVQAIAMSPNGAVGISGSEDQTAKVWNLYTGELIQTFEGHMNGLRAIAISPDGQTVATGDSSGLVNVWDLYSGERLHMLRDFQIESRGLAFAAEGKTLIGTSFSGDIRIWQLPRQLSSEVN